jgi:FkbM family methyltransferase
VIKRIRSHLLGVLLLQNPVEFYCRFASAPKSLLHIGAHLGEEFTFYLDKGIEEICWVEAQEDVFRDLTLRVPPDFCLNALIWSEQIKKTLNVIENSVSSSIFLPEDSIPFELKVRKQDIYTTMTLDQAITVFQGRNKLESKFFLLLDIQGAELAALQGLVKKKRSVQALSCEVSKSRIYKGSPKYYEINFLLIKRGFLPIITFLDLNSRHGDVLYVKISELIRKPKIFLGALAMWIARGYVKTRMNFSKVVK